MRWKSEVGQWWWHYPTLSVHAQWQNQPSGNFYNALTSVCMGCDIRTPLEFVCTPKRTLELSCISWYYENVMFPIPCLLGCRECITVCVGIIHVCNISYPTSLLTPCPMIFKRINPLCEQMKTKLLHNRHAMPDLQNT
jgi:hypothetical protein